MQITLERLKRCHWQSKANWTRGEPFGVGGLGGQHCHTLLGRGWPGGWGLGALSWENYLNLLDLETHACLYLYKNNKIQTNAHNRLRDPRHEKRKLKHKPCRKHILETLAGPSGHVGPCVMPPTVPLK